MGQVAKARVGRGHPRGRTQTVTWIVNDCLMTLGAMG